MQYDRLGSGKLVKDDVVVCIRGSLGKHGRFPFDKGAIASSLVILRSVYNEQILSEFIMMYLDSPLFFYEIKKYDNGTAQPNLAAKSLEQFFVPLPPLSEQRRIISQIENMDSHIDEYNRKNTEIELLQKLFPDKLKKSILQEAIQGKLVPQDPSDEPASVLLERIWEEKDRLVKEGKIKKDNNESVIFRRDNSYYEKSNGVERCIDEELPFEIPDSWEWVRLNSIVSKEIKRGKSPKYAEHGQHYVFAQKCNVKTGGINMSLAKYLSDDIFQKYPTSEYLQDSDIIVNSTGNGTLGRIGIFHDSDRISNGEIVPDSHVTVIRTVNEINKSFVYYTLTYYQPFLERQGDGSTNQTELKPITIASLLFPLPPVMEQDRIVKEIESLFPLCSKLK